MTHDMYKQSVNVNLTKMIKSNLCKELEDQVEP